MAILHGPDKVEGAFLVFATLPSFLDVGIKFGSATTVTNPLFNVRGMWGALDRGNRVGACPCDLGTCYCFDVLVFTGWDHV